MAAVTREFDPMADMLAAEFQRRWPSKVRKVMPAERAYVFGGFFMERILMRVVRARIARAYLVGLRRGYRAGLAERDV